MVDIINTAAVTNTIDSEAFTELTNALRPVYSAEIYYSALPTQRWDQFAVRRVELGEEAGNVLRLPKLSDIKRGGLLTEDVYIGDGRGLELTYDEITIGEYANAVKMTELLLHYSFFDQMANATIALGRDYSVVTDLALRDAVVALTSIVFSNVSGIHSNHYELGATDVFNTTLIKDGVEALEVAGVSKIDGEYFVCFIHPHQGRGVRDDAAWISVNTYNIGGMPIYRGEIGMYEDVKFIQTTTQPNGFNPQIKPNGDYADMGFRADLEAGYDWGGANLNLVDLYEAHLFGEYFYGSAVGYPVELRDNGVIDFGRKVHLAWYSIFGQKILEDSHGIALVTA